MSDADPRSGGTEDAGGAPGTLELPDAEALADFETYAGRARRLDPEGACRLAATGAVLAAYVSPVHGGGGPTVLGLRVLALAAPASLDVTVPLAALVDRFARLRAESPDAGDADAGDVGGDTAGAGADVRRLRVPLPPVHVSAAWAGVAPPRSGWDAVGLLDAARLRAVAATGIGEIADGVPPGAGAQAVARLRGQVWGRPLAPDLPDVPAGVAFAADALAFLDDAEPVALYRAGPWVRATTRRGHVLARRPALLG